MATINGMELKTAAEAGIKDKAINGMPVLAAVMKDGVLDGALTTDGWYHRKYLTRLPKPKTLRPFRRGEVKCGDVFRHKVTDAEVMVVCVHQGDTIFLGVVYSEFSGINYQALLRNYVKLDGSPAGIEE